jgi:fibronectin type 3 domain-containing protein
MSFSDSTVQSGKTYYYVTTAVDLNGAESSFSNQVQAVVPMP